MVVDLPHKPGFYERYLEGDQDRFALSIPDGYDSDRSLPLILVLHWGGPAQPYRGEAILSGLALPALGSLEAIMVAPDCPDHSWTTSRSESYLLTLWDSLQQAYDINPGCRLITGYSMGAIGAWHMAANHQDQFRAALPISATPPEGMDGVEWGIPLYVIHSTDDEIFPLRATQQVVEQLQSNHRDIELNVVRGITHFDVSGFVKPLKDAVPWIRHAWFRQDTQEGSRI